MIIIHLHYQKYFFSNSLIMTLFVDIFIMSYESHKHYNGNLYAGIVKDVKNQQLFMDLQVGIAMDVKNQSLL